MKEISIDLETYSSANLQKCGVYKYAETDDFEILLFGYSVDGSEVKTIDIASGEKIPQNILEALVDNSITKWAFNAQFERICLSRYLRSIGISFDGDYLDASSWKCSMIWSATLGLPLSLEGVGAVLGLEKQKLTEGKNLIRYFCVPCNPSKANGQRTRNLPCHDKEKWELFKKYNIRDVETELGIKAKLSRFPVSDVIWDEYHLDQMINDRGIGIDIDFVKNAIRFDAITREAIADEFINLTEVENPNSVMQLKEWLSKNGQEVESLGKKDVAKLITETSGDINKALELRQQLSKSSVKKYHAMINAACKDNRARGMFQFYGANRTGRFSGRLVQLQNLRQNHISDLKEARTLVKQFQIEIFNLLYDDVPDTLSQLIRTAFVPQNDMKFIVADFSAIEARVLAWIADERWRIQMFKDGGDIYCDSASKMFGVPIVKHGVNGHLRKKGKIAELACIAEGELVLTDVGLVPIEKVTKQMKLWDGESWVSHEGVIYKGKREVTKYDGLTATYDHLVFVKGEDKPMKFVDVIKGRRELLKTGMQFIYDDGQSKDMAIDVYDIRNAGQYHRFTVSGCLVHNCGYGGSAGALKSMGALEMGLSEEELLPLVTAWRDSNPNIVSLWWDVDRCAKETVKTRMPTETHGIKFIYESGFLFIELPSKRRLAYVKPRIGINDFGSECITYEGIGGVKKWERLQTYGPKLVENIVQGIARDILMYSMHTLAGYRIVAHVHDEVIIECPKDTDLDNICLMMAKTPPWASDLILRADGYECEFYKKD